MLNINYFRQRTNFVYTPKRSALIVLDVQNYFANPKGRAYLSSSVAASKNILTIVDVFNKIKRPVILTKHFQRSDAGIMQKFYNDRIKENEWDADIINELKEINAELIEKETYDAFYNTSLDADLKAKGVEQLVITGCMTNRCCETTARSAFVRGYEVYFVSDATFTKTEELHLATLGNVSDAFGVVKTTQEIVEECRKVL